MPVVKSILIDSEKYCYQEIGSEGAYNLKTEILCKKKFCVEKIQHKNVHLFIVFRWHFLKLYGMH